MTSVLDEAREARRKKTLSDLAKPNEPRCSVTGQRLTPREAFEQDCG